MTLSDHILDPSRPKRVSAVTAHTAGLLKFSNPMFKRCIYVYKSSSVSSDIHNSFWYVYDNNT